MTTTTFSETRVAALTDVPARGRRTAVGSSHGLPGMLLLHAAAGFGSLLFVLICGAFF